MRIGTRSALPRDRVLKRTNLNKIARRILNLGFVETVLKSAALQPLWASLHRLSLYGMNYGGGYWFDRSGEKWVVERLGRSLGASGPRTERAVVFDVGAHDGSYSAGVRDVLGERARIYCFEPSLKTFDNLRKTLGDQPEIFLYNLGFGDREEEATLHSTGYGSPGSTLYTPFGAAPGQSLTNETCRLRRLDRFCEEEGIRRIEFLKIDVEGNELNVLRGASGMLKTGAIRLIQFEFGEVQIGSRTFFKDLYRLLTPDYTIHRILRAGLAPIEAYDEIHEIFRTTNYLAVSRTSDPSLFQARTLGGIHSFRRMIERSKVHR